MKTVTWIEATHGASELASLWEFLEQEVRVLAGNRVRVIFRHLPFESGGIRSAPNRLLNDAAVLAAAIDAAEESDAVVIGCWGAPTSIVRSALNSDGCPVVVTSIPEASARAIGSLAKRAVVITVAQSLVPIFSEDLARMGASGFHRERPVRAYTPDSNHEDILNALNEPEALIARFDDEAQKAVEDGADAVVVGCGYLAPIFAKAGYTSVRGHPDVPVLDSARLAMEHARMLLELQAAGIRATMRGHIAPLESQMKPLEHFASRMRVQNAS